jgi:hypothetical protein
LNAERPLRILSYMRRLARALPFLLLLAPSIASATQVEAMSLRALVSEADRVVVGTFVDTDSHYDDRGRIVTDETFRVDETLHGVHQATIVVRTLGGEVGDLGLVIAGEERHALGSRALLFLRTYAPGDLPDGTIVFRPVGMSQGVMPMVAGGGGDVVMPGGSGVTIVTRMPDGSLAPGDVALPSPQPRDELLARIRDLVGEVHGE